MSYIMVWARDEGREPVCRTDDPQEAAHELFERAREALLDEVGVLVLEQYPITDDAAFVVVSIEHPNGRLEAVAALFGLTYDEVLALGPNPSSIIKGTIFN